MVVDRFECANARLEKARACHNVQFVEVITARLDIKLSTMYV